MWPAVKLLVMETKRHYDGHLDRIDGGPSPLSDVTVAEMLVFLAITKQWDIAYGTNWQTSGQITNQFKAPFYSSAMKRDRYLHFLRFLHFTDKNNEPDMREGNSDRLWKMRNLFEILNKTFWNFYRPSEYLAVDEFIVLFKGRVIVRQYIPKKHKRFWQQNLQNMSLDSLIIT